MKTVKYRSPYNAPVLSLFNRKNMYRNQEECRKKCEREIKRLKKNGIQIIAAKQYLENLISRNCSFFEVPQNKIISKTLMKFKTHLIAEPQILRI